MVPEQYQGVGGNIMFKQLSENTLNNVDCETSRHFGNNLKGIIWYYDEPIYNYFTNYQCDNL